MKEINDLPIYDIWPIIFKNLSIQDLFNCRLVNKQFKYFSDHSNGVFKLVIGEPYFDYENYYYWNHNYKSIEDKEIISLKCFHEIKLLSIFNLNKNLKYLKIYDSKLGLKELTNLNNLEILELNCHYDEDQIINLNNLKVLIFHHTQQNYFNLELNTPKLEYIEFENMNIIKFKSNSESIKHLITNDYYQVDVFKNLEILELRSIHFFPDGDLSNILKNNLKLKQLKIDLILNGDSNYENEQIKNYLIEILNDRIKLRREIDIYLEGIKIDNIEKFDEFSNVHEYKHSYFKLLLNNYDLLDSNLPFISYLPYNHLENCFINGIENDLPSSFFDKFTKISSVNVNQVKSVDGLSWFLNNLKNLSELEICFNGLGQDFFNNLPSTIRFLTIPDKDINYDFILKLSKLIKFNTGANKDLFDLSLTSFSNLKYLKDFEFRFNKEKISIEKVNKKFYLNYNRHRELDYNQLVEECNIIRSKLNE